MKGMSMHVAEDGPSTRQQTGHQAQEARQDALLNQRLSAPGMLRKHLAQQQDLSGRVLFLPARLQVLHCSGQQAVQWCLRGCHLLARNCLGPQQGRCQSQTWVRRLLSSGGLQHATAQQRQQRSSRRLQHRGEVVTALTQVCTSAR